jgi:hypothetical protein
MKSKPDRQPSRRPSRAEKIAQTDPEWDALSQREKFIRTAREVGADETGEEFERAFSRAFPPREPGVPVAPYVQRQPPKGSRRKAKPGPG